MRASRLLSILLTLQARGQSSAHALAKEFEVSVRTIHRDIDELSAAGVPVYAKRGREGGFRLLDGYRVRLNGLTNLEAEALALSNLPGPARELGLGDALLSAHLKMLAALPDDRRAVAERTMSRFHLDPAGWYQKKEPVPFLGALARAVWTTHTVRIRYRSWNADVDRTLHPLGIVLKSGIWYLVARVSKDIRTFRASNVLSLTVLDTIFHPPKLFDLSAYWENWSRDFEQSLYTGKAILRVSPDGMKRLMQMSAAVGEAAERSASRADRYGWRKVTVPIESIEHATIELMRLAEHGEVLQPAALRTRISESARATANTYSRRQRRDLQTVEIRKTERDRLPA
ncbi:MAG: YafY family protein [Micropepsaceae bacterium]